MSTDYPEYWAECRFEQLLNYIQPGPYIVENTDYDDSYDTPVLTAGKSFIKGYTNETGGIFEETPVIIFDDFTTATQFVNFRFKVKSSAMKILVPTSSELDLKFLYYLMQITHVNTDSHKRYWIGIYSKENICVPPANEQHRIIGKIEELFSELDKGIESLKTAREQLKVYRQALLKRAFEGELTEQWRKDNADKLETADQLLDRVEQQREASYKEQQEEWKEALKEWEFLGKEGKTPPRPKQPKKFDLSCTKTKGIPATWCVVPLEVLILFGPTNGWSPKTVSEVTSTKAITLTATTSGQFDGSEFKYIDTEIPKHSSLWLKHNDIIVQRGNTMEYVGVPALYTGENNEYIYPDLMMKVRPVESISAQYIVYAMSMNSSRGYLRERAVGAAGSMPKINQKTLCSLPIPVCSASEQRRIVELLEEKFSITDSGIQEIEVQLSKAEVLRQSILKKAFSGQLVPQDPDDEPASVLLERIAKEKEETAAQAKQAKTTKKKPKKKETSMRKAS